MKLFIVPSCFVCGSDDLVESVRSAPFGDVADIPEGTAMVVFCRNPRCYRIITEADARESYTEGAVEWGTACVRCAGSDSEPGTAQAPCLRCDHLSRTTGTAKARTPGA